MIEAKNPITLSVRELISHGVSVLDDPLIINSLMKAIKPKIIDLILEEENFKDANFDFTLTVTKE